jgi:hypothetical protein
MAPSDSPRSPIALPRDSWKGTLKPTLAEFKRDKLNHWGAAGVLFVVGIISALWAASGYVSAFADASNTIYEVDEGRPFWKLKPLQLAVSGVRWAEFNAETERARQIEAGVAGAERELKLEPRETAQVD